MGWLCRLLLLTESRDELLEHAKAEMEIYDLASGVALAQALRHERVQPSAAQ